MEGVRLWGEGDTKQVLNKKERAEKTRVSPSRGRRAALAMAPKAASLASPFMTGHTGSGPPDGEVCTFAWPRRLHRPRGALSALSVRTLPFLLSLEGTSSASQSLSTGTWLC